LIIAAEIDPQDRDLSILDGCTYQLAAAKVKARVNWLKF
jgi:hypothetical protein